MKAYLNGVLLTRNEISPQSIETTYNRQNTASYAGSVDFTGWAYDLLKSELIDSPKGWIKSVPFRIEKTCCDESEVFNGIVRGDRIDWDSTGCVITADIIEESDERGALRYIKKTLITDNLTPDGHPFVFTANGRGFVSIAVQVIVTQILIIILSIFRPLIAFFDTLAGQSSTLFEDYQDFMSALSQQNISLLGQTPTMPLVREIITQNLSAGGYSFSSSILNDSASDYYNLSYLSVIQRPYTLLTPGGNINKDNMPIRSVFQFLEELKVPFNAEFFFIGDTLHFERRDLLPQLPALDISQQSNLSISFSYKADNKAAYFDLQYTQDSQEKGSAELYNDFSHIEEWNPLNDETQEGAFEVIVPYAAYASGVPFKSQGIANIAAFILKGQGVAYNEGAVTLELSDTFVYVPKLVPVLPQGDAWILDLGDQMKGEQLYDNFYSIENPRDSGFRGVEFSATFDADCDFLDSISGLLKITLPYGNESATAYVNDIVVNWTSKQVTVNGEL